MDSAPVQKQEGVADVLDYRMSRRAMGRIGVMGATGVALASILAACGGGSEEPAPTSESGSSGGSGGASATQEATQEPAGQAKSGGSITVGMNREPDSMDQHVGSSRYNEMVNANIYDRLLEYDADGNYIPGLLERWEAGSDGLSWTLTFKQGVKFHDGTPLNAEAAKFNFDRIADPETKSQKAVGLLGPYEGTEVIDDYTVTLTFTDLYAGFIDAMASFYLVMQSPAAIEKFGADYGQNPVGTGPYMFKEWVQKDHLTIVRNPDYTWGPTGEPAYLDEITFKFIPENATRVTTLETGETDIIVNTPLQDYDRLSTDSNFTVMMAPVLGQPPSMIINTEKPPTDDVKVRQAIQYAIDQDEIIDVIYYGVYERAYGPLTQYNRYYDSSVEDMYPHDLDQANALLEEAGWTLGSDGIRQKDGQPLRLVYLTFPASDGLAELIQAQLRRAGIDVEILQLDNPANLSASQAGEHSLRWLNWLFSDAGELSTTFHSKNIGSGWNFSRWRSDELDQLLDQGQEEMDPDQRAEIYSQAQKIVMEASLLVPMYVGTQVLTMRSALKGVRIHRLGDTPLFVDAYLDE